MHKFSLGDRVKISASFYDIRFAGLAGVVVLDLLDSQPGKVLVRVRFSSSTTEEVAVAVGMLLPWAGYRINPDRVTVSPVELSTPAELAGAGYKLKEGWPQ